MQSDRDNNEGERNTANQTVHNKKSKKWEQSKKFN